MYQINIMKHKNILILKAYNYYLVHSVSKFRIVSTNPQIKRKDSRIKRVRIFCHHSKLIRNCHNHCTFYPEKTNTSFVYRILKERNKQDGKNQHLGKSLLFIRTLPTFYYKIHHFNSIRTKRMIPIGKQSHIRLKIFQRQEFLYLKLHDHHIPNYFK